MVRNFIYDLEDYRDYDLMRENSDNAIMKRENVRETNVINKKIGGINEKKPGN